MAGIEIERGKRLRILRQMTGLTIKEFANLCGVGESTIRQWDAGRGTGLSIKGAHKIIKAAKDGNIQCEAQWLLEGKGQQPEFKEGYQPKASVKAQKIYVEQQIEKEIQFFCQQNNKPVFIRVNDNAMEPYFHENDYVGGSLCLEANKKSLNNQFCIINLSDGRMLVRKIKISHNTHQLKLVVTNEKVKAQYPPIVNAKIISLAVITRVWKPTCITE